MNNLPAKYLYDAIPANVVNEDVRDLIEAVACGYQDRLSELRALAAQIQEIWVPTNTVGELAPVVLLVYTDENGSARTLSLSANSSLPSDQSLLPAWAAAQAKISIDAVQSAALTTDPSRTALSRTLPLLASTLGAALYSPINPAADEQIANQKRVLKSYFTRLKIKGTAQSFDLFGRLHGFKDVFFSPLWGRLSPRNPGNVGSSVNDQDFSQIPQGNPTPGRVTPTYDPAILNDGDIFTWSTAGLTTVKGSSTFVADRINGQNPFFAVSLTSTSIGIPASGTYVFSGGTYGRPAQTGPLSDSAGNSTGLNFTAIAAGASFNGMAITVVAAGSTFAASVSYNLSLVKFRTSYFDLAVTADIDNYSLLFMMAPTASPDLLANPSLWSNSGLGQYQTLEFSNNGVASAPFLYWGGGAVLMPLVTAWPKPGTATAISPNPYTAQSATESSGSSQPVLDLTALTEAASNLLGDIDDIRPATRYLRKFSFGFSLEDQVQYAKYLGYDLLHSISASGTITGTLSDPKSYSLYAAGFFYRPAAGGQVPVQAETSAANPDVVYLAAALPGTLVLTGTYQLSTGQYTLNVTDAGAPGNLYVSWDYVSTDTVQQNPAGVDFSLNPTLYSDSLLWGFSDRPEDEVDVSLVTNVTDSYPWNKMLVAAGTVLDPDYDFYENLQVRAVKLGATVVLFDENKVPYTMSSVETGRTDRGYSLAAQAANSDYGQLGVGFMGTGTNLELNEAAVIGTGPLSSVEVTATDSPPTGNGWLVNGVLTGTPAYTLDRPDGTPYYVGLVCGIMVASPEAHWSPAQADGLVNWLHLGEHPQQPYTVTDSAVASSASGQSQSCNYSAMSRLWDPSRGWVLALQSAATLPPEQLTVTQVRNQSTSGYTVSAFINPPNESDYPVSKVIELDSISVLASRSGSVLNLSLTASDAQVISGPVSAGFGLFYLSVLPLQQEDAVDIGACATTNVSNLSGVQEIDGTTVSDGLVLIAGQTDATKNGCYLAGTGPWIRLQSLDSGAEAGKLYYCGSGKNAGFYVCRNKSTIAYGSDSVVYSPVSCAWHSSLTAALTILSVTIASGIATVFFNATHNLLPGDSVFLAGGKPAGFNGLYAIKTCPASNKITVAAPVGLTVVTTVPACVPVVLGTLPNPASVSSLSISGISYFGAGRTGFSDVRVWDKFKTPTELAIIARPPIKPCAVAARPIFMAGTTGALRSIEVLASGYAFPSAQIADYYSQNLWRLAKYDGFGEYDGPKHLVEVGYGDAPTPSGQLVLGTRGFNISSAGKGVAATQNSNLPGNSKFWETDSGVGSYVVVSYPGGSVSVASTPHNPDGTVTDPGYVFAQNPGLLYAYFLGEDGNLYIGSANVDISTGVKVATLVATPAPTVPLQDIIPSVAQLQSGMDDNFNAYTGANFGLVVAEVNPGAQFQPEILSAAHSKLEVLGAGRLAVVQNGGAPIFAQLPTGGTRTTPPIYLYSLFQNVLNTAYSPMPALAGAGTLTLAGNGIALAPGNYSIILDICNVGADDNAFTGFGVSAGFSGAVLARAVALPQGSPYFRVSYTYGSETAASESTISSCSVAQFAAAINQLATLTGGAVVQTSGSYVSQAGGPFYVKFSENGAQPLLSFLVTKGLAVSVTRLVTGSLAQQEVQKIEFQRPLVQLKVSLPDGAPSNWSIQVTLPNSVAVESGVASLAVHGLVVQAINAEAYKVELGASVYTLTKVDAGAPFIGGNKLMVSDSGFVEVDSEINVRPKDASFGDSTFTSENPVGALVTGSTADRASVILTDSWDLPDEQAPASQSVPAATLYAEDKSTGNLTVIATA